MNYNIYIVITFFCVAPALGAANMENAIINLHAGRLGDRIKVCCIAQYLSDKYDIPFFYTDYALFNDLKISDCKQKYDPDMHRFKQVIQVFHENQIAAHKNESILYVVRPGTQLAGGLSLGALMAKNVPFKKVCRKLFSPKVPLQKAVSIPEKSICVAVHVRRGGGYDRPLSQLTESDQKFNDDYAELLIKAAKSGRHPPKFADKRWPLKFPPDKYYIDQIKAVFNFYKGKPLFVHIFTDDKNPQEIVNIYKAALNNDLITFSCRESDNSHKNNVLEDLFTMMDFDCLIRPDSGFSQIAEFFGKHSLVIAPKSYTWQETKLIIDKVCIKYKKDKE